MPIFPLTRTRRPRQFSYTPRYYDPRRERFEAIVSRARQERDRALGVEAQGESADDSGYEGRLRLSFEEAHFVQSRRANRTRTRMLISVFLLILVFIIYLML